MVRRGFSVVELAIAFVILGLAVLPVIQLFGSASQQAKQTADYSLAVAVQSSVNEDLRLENWENPHLLNDLVAAPPSPQPLCGARPYFETLEDDVQPYGLILRGVDPPIMPQTKLGRDFATFNLALVPGQARAVGTAGQVQDCDVGVDWLDFRQERRRLGLDAVLGRFAPVGEPAAAPLDRTGADAAIRNVLYPAATGDLASAVSAAGGDLATIRAIGDITLLAAARSAVSSVYEAEIAALTAAVAAAPDDLARARAQVAVGRRHEAEVAGVLQVMSLLTPPLQALSGFQPALLGNPRPERSACRTGMISAGWQMFELADALVRASQAYALACEPPLGSALPSRVRVRVFFKLLELAKLQALTCGPNDTEYAKQLLETFAVSQLGRNPNFYRFARADLVVCRDLATLTTQYPASWRKRIWDAFKAAALPAVPAVVAAR